MSSLKQLLVEFLLNEPKSLAQMYAAFPKIKQHSIRARLNESVNTSFKRISKGIYLAIEGDTKALIIEGDAWNVIKEFDTDSVDAIITDPGYTCLNKHYSTGTTRKNDIGFVTKDVDKELLDEMFRVLKPSGHFFCFAPTDAKDTLDYNNSFIESARASGFEFNKRFVWNKDAIGMGYNGRNKYEQIFFMSKGKRHMPYDKSIPDLLTHKRIHHTKRVHSAEKPISLLQELLKFSCQQGDVALDPFGGSMSLAHAGLLEGVHTVSIEMDSSAIKKAIEE